MKIKETQNPLKIRPTSGLGGCTAIDDAVAVVAFVDSIEVCLTLSHTTTGCAKPLHTFLNPLTKASLKWAQICMCKHTRAMQRWNSHNPLYVCEWVAAAKRWRQWRLHCKYILTYTYVCLCESENPLRFAYALSPTTRTLTLIWRLSAPVGSGRIESAWPSMRCFAIFALSSVEFWRAVPVKEYSKTSARAIASATWNVLMRKMGGMVDMRLGG